MPNIAMKCEVFHDIFCPATSFTCPKGNDVLTMILKTLVSTKQSTGTHLILEFNFYN